MIGMMQQSRRRPLLTGIALLIVGAFFLSAPTDVGARSRDAAESGAEAEPQDVNDRDEVLKEGAEALMFETGAPDSAIPYGTYSYERTSAVAKELAVQTLRSVGINTFLSGALIGGAVMAIFLGGLECHDRRRKATEIADTENDANGVRSEEELLVDSTCKFAVHSTALLALAYLSYFDWLSSVVVLVTLYERKYNGAFAWPCFIAQFVVLGLSSIIGGAFGAHAAANNQREGIAPIGRQLGFLLGCVGLMPLVETLRDVREAQETRYSGDARMLEAVVQSAPSFVLQSVYLVSLASWNGVPRPTTYSSWVSSPFIVISAGTAFASHVAQLATYPTSVSGRRNFEMHAEMRGRLAVTVALACYFGSDLALRALAACVLCYASGSAGAVAAAVVLALYPVCNALMATLSAGNWSLAAIGSLCGSFTAVVPLLDLDDGAEPRYARLEFVVSTLACVAIIAGGLYVPTDAPVPAGAMPLTDGSMLWSVLGMFGHAPPPTHALPGAICTNTCSYYGVSLADNGECDDGGPGSEWIWDMSWAWCPVGSDCTDCDVHRSPPTVPTSLYLVRTVTWLTGALTGAKTVSFVGFVWPATHGERSLTAI